MSSTQYEGISEDHGRFPEVDRLFPKKGKRLQVTPTDAAKLLSATKAALAGLKGKDKEHAVMRFAVDNERLVVVDDAPNSFGINPNYLLTVLTTIGDTFDVTLGMGNGKVGIVEFSNDDYRILLMPLRR